MLDITKTVSAALVAVSLAWPVAAQDTPDADTVIATVNGKEIKLGHLIMIRASLPEQYQQLPNSVLWDGILDQVIQQEVLSQDEAASETRRVQLALDNERRSLLASEVVAKIAGDAVTDEAVQAAYQAQYVDGEQGKEYNASHILVETEEEAKALVETLAGGADFAELAKEKSTGPSGPNGGSLGWFGAGMMVPEFESAVVAMEVGAVSAPVQTQFGWHVIKLNETRDQSAPALESVRQQIEGEIQQKAVQAYIDAQTSAAEVTRLGADEIDIELLTNIQLLED